MTSATLDAHAERMRDRAAAERKAAAVRALLKARKALARKRVDAIMAAAMAPEPPPPEPEPAHARGRGRANPNQARNQLRLGGGLEANYVVSYPFNCTARPGSEEDPARAAWVDEIMGRRKERHGTS